MRKGYCDGPFGQLHFIDEGDGVPIVLIHQMVQSSLQFRPAQFLLAKQGLRALAIDLPGYGMSVAPDHGPTMDEYASIVPSVLNHLGLKQAVICGHHTGAAVACAVAHRYPEVVSKLIIHGVPYYTGDQRAARALASHSTMPIAMDGSHFTRLWNTMKKASDHQASNEITHLSTLLYFMAGETEWHGHHAVYTYDIETAIEAISAPTLLISNTGDMLSPSDRRLAAVRPDFSFLEIEGGTFQYVYDNAENWARVVGEFALRRAP